MIHPLEQLRDDALGEIEAAPDEQALEGARVKYLGKSGTVSAWGERIKTLNKDEKPVVGKLLNEVRTAVTASIEARATTFREQKESGALARIDISYAVFCLKKKKKKLKAISRTSEDKSG